MELLVKEAMLASERLLEIEEKFEAKVERIVPVELDEETLRVILYLRNGDEITSPSRRIDLGQICSISNHKS